jgi:hypothetical protein
MNEVADVLARYGFAPWVQRGDGLLDAGVMKRLSDRVVDPEIDSSRRASGCVAP